MMRIKAELLRVEVIVLILTAVIFVLFSIGEPSFATSGNLFLFATFSAELGLVAFGELFVLVAGEVDLSPGGVFALTCWVYDGIAVGLGGSLLLAAIPTLIFALSIGFLQGYLCLRLRVPAFIVTLVGMLLWRGIMTAITGGVNYSYLGDKTTLFSTILEGNIGGFPIVFFWFIVFAVIFTVLLTRTKFGNHVLAVGGNPTVARNVGVRVERTKIRSFALCSLMAGVAAVFYFNRIFFIAPDTQVGIELFGICACVIGGAMVGGGHGNVMGAALGAITVIMLRFGLPMIGVPANLFTAIVGIALLVFAIVHLKMKGMSVG